MNAPLIAAVLGTSCATVIAQSPGLYFPGLAPETDWGWTTSLSQNGSIAAGFSAPQGTSVPAPGYIWSLATGRVDFGIEPGIVGQSGAYGINSDGSIVVGRMLNTAGTRAYRRVGSGSLEDLGTMGYSTSFARGVSGDGNTVIGYAETNIPQFGIYEAQAFRWTPSGGMQGLGWIGSSTVHSEARAISRDGSTIVGIGDFAYPFVWRESTGMQQLPVHPGAPNENGYAYGVNADGSVIVGRARNASGQNVATRWTTIGIEELSLLPGATNSIAYAVSDDGSLVAGSSGISPNQVATVWTVGSGAMSLADYLDLHGVSVPSEWRFEYIYAVSGDGLTFAGEARSPEGIRQGFVATVPAPAGLLVFVCAAPLALRRRRGIH